MNPHLRSRYRALLRCYPAAYRAEHGDELVDMYLDLAHPGQRFPRPGDVADLVRGGARQHLRARQATGLADALPLAAMAAMPAAAALAAVLLLRVEYVPDMVFQIRHPGPFLSLGAFAWLAWLLPPVTALAGPARPAVWLALAVTAGITVAGPLAPYDEGVPLFVVVPQLALGVVALAFPARPAAWLRLAPLAAAAVVTALTLAVMRVPGTYWQVHTAHLAAAGLLATTGLAASGVLLARRDRRGLWPLLILLVPMVLLAQVGVEPATRPDLIARLVRAAAPGVLALAVLPLAVLISGRRQRP
ncbi:GlsB/YeaQ/YmgE family stress response membrane protein [Dactylosporangium sp. NPDC049140]|uniref:GlsB/YeaQ/YmgE family stress response membrane protein n=1 Tax=Dactylosporangium sp. NPDC049140 TaxID=3155647 RepID=UPI0033E92896